MVRRQTQGTFGNNWTWNGSMGMSWTAISVDRRELKTATIAYLKE